MKKSKKQIKKWYAWGAIATVLILAAALFSQLGYGDLLKTQVAPMQTGGVIPPGPLSPTFVPGPPVTIYNATNPQGSNTAPQAVTPNLPSTPSYDAATCRDLRQKLASIPPFPSNFNNPPVVCDPKMDCYVYGSISSTRAQCPLHTAMWDLMENLVKEKMLITQMEIHQCSLASSGTRGTSNSTNIKALVDLESACWKQESAKHMICVEATHSLRALEGVASDKVRQNQCNGTATDKPECAGLLQDQNFACQQYKNAVTTCNGPINPNFPPCRLLP